MLAFSFVPKHSPSVLLVVNSTSVLNLYQSDMLRSVINVGAPRGLVVMKGYISS